MSQNEFEMEKIDSRLADMYTSNENKQQKYDTWAGQYENDLVNELDYVAHIETATIFTCYVTNKNARTIDIACGTGLVGDELKRHGYTNIDGVDFSEEMLNQSAQKNSYQNLFQHDFTQPLIIENRYDALICVGLFSFSLPGIDNLIHPINLVKPNGCCILTVNGAAWDELKLESAVKQQSKQHNFAIEDIIDANYIKREQIGAKVLVIRAPEENKR